MSLEYKGKKLKPKNPLDSMREYWDAEAKLTRKMMSLKDYLLKKDFLKNIMGLDDEEIKQRYKNSILTDIFILDKNLIEKDLKSICNLTSIDFKNKFDNVLKSFGNLIGETDFSIDKVKNLNEEKMKQKIVSSLKVYKNNTESKMDSNNSIEKRAEYLEENKNIALAMNLLLALKPQNERILKQASKEVFEDFNHASNNLINEESLAQLRTKVNKEFGLVKEVIKKQNTKKLKLKAFN